MVKGIRIAIGASNRVPEGNHGEPVMINAAMAVLVSAGRKRDPRRAPAMKAAAEREGMEHTTTKIADCVTRTMSGNRIATAIMIPALSAIIVHASCARSIVSEGNVALMIEALSRAVHVPKIPAGESQSQGENAALRGFWGFLSLACTHSE
ncbi:hypothetical protein [Microbacterium suwonense]|uniref:Uncharacterized protein n=1 Tax=Microbacterium suwonense TaxID=683047 RepID=A0ABM8FVG8_9MICO|nr:hypothetical protein [Microbacterium suwonense]BDZ39694.1 hypothetical protein GCM10025863_23080 [Microbacterium suwonense]